METYPHVIMVYNILHDLLVKDLSSNKIPPDIHGNILFKIIEDKQKLLHLDL